MPGFEVVPVLRAAVDRRVAADVRALADLERGTFRRSELGVSAYERALAKLYAFVDDRGGMDQAAVA